MLFSKDIGIDLGTANTLMCARGKIIMREPSVVAYDVRNDLVKAVGKEAKEMIGRTPGSIAAVRPLKDGVVADFDFTAAMLKKFIKQALRGSIWARVRLLISVPAGITEVESRAVYDAAKQAGAAYVELIEEPMAAAIGAGLPTDEAKGCMVVDIGGGTTGVAVISLGDIVTAQSIRVAGDNFDKSITDYIRKKHGMLIGERTAEQIKIQIGSVLPYENEESMEIKGRNVDGLPKTILITAEEIREAMARTVRQIADAVRSTLEKTHPELSADILDSGITLTGGGANLRGLDKYLEQETGMPVKIADHPMDCVVLGTAKQLEKTEFLGNTFRNTKRYR
ncbi:MAG: rod shape-determining protein [Oscillospiraceae bacterium]|nr:rod shape-determining protein [Candidatus Equicaccousia limihippi]